jgi:hypothetical protein
MAIMLMAFPGVGRPTNSIAPGVPMTDGRFGPEPGFRRATAPGFPATPEQRNTENTEQTEDAEDPPGSF